MNENTEAKIIRDRIISSKRYGTFSAILIGAGFTVIAILLSFGDIENIDFLTSFLFKSIFWLVISICSNFESLIANIQYERYAVYGEVKNYFFYLGGFCWYFGYYAFILSIIYLLLNVQYFLIALILYYFLYRNIITWSSIFIKQKKPISQSSANKEKELLEYKEILEDLKVQGKKKDENLRKKIYRRINVQKWSITFIKILIILFIGSFYVVYFFWVGKQIYQEIWESNGVIFHFISFFIIWLFVILFLKIHSRYFKIKCKSCKKDINEKIYFCGNCYAPYHLKCIRELQMLGENCKNCNSPFFKIIYKKNKI